MPILYTALYYPLSKEMNFYYFGTLGTSLDRMRREFFRLHFYIIVSSTIPFTKRRKEHYLLLCKSLLQCQSGGVTKDSFMFSLLLFHLFRLSWCSFCP